MTDLPRAGGTALPPSRPGRGWYAFSAGLAAAALAIGIVLAVIIGRAVAGYSIEPMPVGQPVEIVLGDRGEAVWATPDGAIADCRSTDVDRGQSSIGRGTADRVNVTRGGRTWVRVAIVEGPPGSRHTLTCTDLGATGALGHAPNPRFGHYVVLGIAGGGVAGMLGIAALVMFVVVAVKRSRRPATP